MDLQKLYLKKEELFRTFSKKSSKEKIDHPIIENDENIDKSNNTTSILMYDKNDESLLSSKKDITRRRLTVVNNESEIYHEKPQFYWSIPLLKSKKTENKNVFLKDWKKNDQYSIKTGCVETHFSCSIAGESPFQFSKQNQDDHFEIIDHQNVIGNYIFAVMDGHGYNGQLVSKLLKDKLPKFIKTICYEAGNSGVSVPHKYGINLYKNSGTVSKYAGNAANSTLNNANSTMNNNNFVYGFNNESITKVFDTANTELVKKSTIDCSLSGSTCILIFIIQDKIICANVGDSRAILGSFSNGEWQTIPLSFDHKPSRPDENQRIIQNGGKVEPILNEYGVESGPERVWKATGYVPGLAMSRSMGDTIAASVGVISKPEFIEHTISCNDRIIILGTDGVWEFISSEEAMEIVSVYYDLRDVKGACDALIRESLSRWMQTEGISDDITCTVIFLNP